MQPRLLKFWDEVRASYWFIPLLMTIAAIVLAAVTTALDKTYGHDWLEAVPWLIENRPDGARQILSTIAGSMITVAGVVFSITVVAVVHASAQLGPRLLTNFMRDRGNQITLGTFIATFLYCILVLRTVQSPEDAMTPGAGEDLAAGFVPHIGMLGALVLTLCSVGVLIYFIHHIPKSIHVSHVVAEVGKELRLKVEQRLPEGFGEPVPEDVERSEVEPDDFGERAVTVEADGSGYVQAVNEKALLDIAVENDLILELHVRPGIFVRPGKALVEAYPRDRVTEKIADSIRLSYAWGNKRTPLQDDMFLVNELAEIGIRALSPGINDPFTAVSCIDWLADGLASFASREVPDRFRFDEGGALRVIAHPIDLEEFAEAALGQIAPYAAVDRVAGLHLLSAIGELSEGITSDQGRDLLRHYAGRVINGAEAELQDPGTLALFRQRYRDVMRLLRRDGENGAAAGEAEWMAESS
jgi:uncharacterized membrane protein